MLCHFEPTAHSAKSGLEWATPLDQFSIGDRQSTINICFYQSPQWDTDICWNFIFQASPCFTQTVLKC